MPTQQRNDLNFLWLCSAGEKLPSASPVHERSEMLWEVVGREARGLAWCRGLGSLLGHCQPSCLGSSPPPPATTGHTPVSEQLLHYLVISMVTRYEPHPVLDTRNRPPWSWLWTVFSRLGPDTHSFPPPLSPFPILSSEANLSAVLTSTSAQLVIKCRVIEMLQRIQSIAEEEGEIS